METRQKSLQDQLKKYFNIWLKRKIADTNAGLVNKLHLKLNEKTPIDFEFNYLFKNDDPKKWVNRQSINQGQAVIHFSEGNPVKNGAEEKQQEIISGAESFNTDNISDKEGTLTVTTKMEEQEASEAERSITTTESDSLKVGASFSIFDFGAEFTDEFTTSSRQKSSQQSSKTTEVRRELAVPSGGANFKLQSTKVTSYQPYKITYVLRGQIAIFFDSKYEVKYDSQSHKFIVESKKISKNINKILISIADIYQEIIKEESHSQVNDFNFSSDKQRVSFSILCKKLVNSEIVQEAMATQRKDQSKKQDKELFVSDNPNTLFNKITTDLAPYAPSSNVAGLEVVVQSPEALNRVSDLKIDKMLQAKTDPEDRKSAETIFKQIHEDRPKPGENRPAKHSYNISSAKFVIGGSD